MRKFNYAVVLTLAATLTSCTMFKKNQPSNETASSRPESTQVQTENKDKEAFNKAASLTSGWPESSVTAANEMIQRYGDPQETTSNSLIWRNVAPFREIKVHKVVYSHRFPLLHQNALEHVVDYKAPLTKIDDVWRFNGSIVLNRTNGQMSSYAENEAMNILGLNLAHLVMQGRMSADAARITYGKETLNFMNGNKTAYTQVLSFGTQFETADQGETITNKIRWIGDPSRRPAQNINTRQAQEEKK